MQRLHWSPVFSGDEYRERGDEQYVDVREYAYYFNSKRMVVRRYGRDGSYCEARVLRLPKVDRLANVFASAKYNGSLRAVEPGTPEQVAA